MVMECQKKREKGEEIFKEKMAENFPHLLQDDHLYTWEAQGAPSIRNEKIFTDTPQ